MLDITKGNKYFPWLLYYLSKDKLSLKIIVNRIYFETHSLLNRVLFLKSYTFPFQKRLVNLQNNYNEIGTLTNIF